MGARLALGGQVGLTGGGANEKVGASPPPPPHIVCQRTPCTCVIALTATVGTVSNLPVSR